MVVHNHSLYQTAATATSVISKIHNPNCLDLLHNLFVLTDSFCLQIFFATEPEKESRPL